MSSLMDGLVTNGRCWGHRTCHSFGVKPDIGQRYQRWVCVPSSGTKQDFAAGGDLPAWAVTTGQLFTHEQAPSPNTPHESSLTVIGNSHKPLSYLQTARVFTFPLLYTPTAAKCM